MSYKNISSPRDASRFTLVLRARRRHPASDRVYEFEYEDDQAMPVAVNNDVAFPVSRTVVCPGAIPFDILAHDHYPGESRILFPVRFTVFEYEWIPIEPIRIGTARRFGNDGPVYEVVGHFDKSVDVVFDGMGQVSRLPASMVRTHEIVASVVR